jgi:hypothetical protein
MPSLTTPPLRPIDENACHLRLPTLQSHLEISISQPGQGPQTSVPWSWDSPRVVKRWGKPLTSKVSLLVLVGLRRYFVALLVLGSSLRPPCCDSSYFDFVAEPFFWAVGHIVCVSMSRCGQLSYILEYPQAVKWGNKRY